MWVGVREIGRLAGLRWAEVAGVGGAAGAVWLLRIRSRARTAEWRREQRTNDELLAYARLDVRLSAGGQGGGSGCPGELVDGREERISSDCDAVAGWEGRDSRSRRVRGWKSGRFSR